MSVTHGMDPFVVREVVRGLTDAAGQLDDLGNLAHGVIHALEWEGPDVVRLTEQWDSEGRPHLSHVAEELRQASNRLLAEVEDQHETSGFGGGGSGGGGDGGGLLDGLGDLFGGIGDLAGDIWDGLGDLAGDLWEGLGNAADAVGDGLGWLGGKIGDGLGWVGGKIADGMDWAADGIEWLTDQAGGAIKGVTSWAGGLLGHLGPVGKFFGDGLSGLGDAIGSRVEAFGDGIPRLVDSVQNLAGQFGQILTDGKFPSVSSVVASIALVTGNVAGLGANALTGEDQHFFDDGTPVLGDPTTVTNPTRPQDLVDLVTMVDEAQGARPDGSGNIRITTVQGPNGPATVVSVPGTTDWGPGTSGQSPVDATGNLVAVTGEQSTASQAVEMAIDRARADGTIPPGSPVLLVGHSQGGIIASQLASDPAFVERNNITNMMTFGAPIDGVTVDSRVNTLALQHTTDPVPRLDLGGFGSNHTPSSSVTTVTLDNDPRQSWYNPFAQHGGETYAYSLDHVSGGDAAALAAYQSDLYDFLGGSGATAVDVPISREVEED